MVREETPELHRAAEVPPSPLGLLSGVLKAPGFDSPLLSPIKKGVIMERRIRTFNTKDEAEEHLTQLHSTFIEAPPFCPITRTDCQVRCVAFRSGVVTGSLSGNGWLTVSPHCASPLVSGELLMEETR